MERTKRFIVDAHVSYTVEADTPDSALRAILPIVGNHQGVTFSIREVTDEPTRRPQAPEKYAHLTKSAYSVNEVAEILGLSKNLVYEKVPCIRVGARRLYPRATLIEILQSSIKPEEPAIRPERRRYAEPRKPAKIITTEPESKGDGEMEAAYSKFLTLKQAAAMLGLSYGKTKELFDSRKIYSIESDGKRIILRKAIEYFLSGGTAREYVEDLIKYAREHRRPDDDAKALEKWAREMRTTWAD